MPVRRLWPTCRSEDVLLWRSGARPRRKPESSKPSRKWPLVPRSLLTVRASNRHLRRSRSVMIRGDAPFSVAREHHRRPSIAIAPEAPARPHPRRVPSLEAFRRRPGRPRAAHLVQLLSTRFSERSCLNSGESTPITKNVGSSCEALLRDHQSDRRPGILLSIRRSSFFKSAAM